jgi:hypothetical protein
VGSQWARSNPSARPSGVQAEGDWEEMEGSVDFHLQAHLPTPPTYRPALAAVLPEVTTPPKITMGGAAADVTGPSTWSIDARCRPPSEEWCTLEGRLQRRDQHFWVETMGLEPTTPCLQSTGRAFIRADIGAFTLVRGGAGLGRTPLTVRELHIHLHTAPSGDVLPVSIPRACTEAAEPSKSTRTAASKQDTPGG